MRSVDEFGAAAVTPAGTAVYFICKACSGLPHAQLVERLEIVERPEFDQMFVAHAKIVECAIALECGLDPGEFVDWEIAEWNYGLEGRRPRN